MTGNSGPPSFYNELIRKFSSTQFKIEDGNKPRGELLPEVRLQRTKVTGVSKSLLLAPIIAKKTFRKKFLPAYRRQRSPKK